MIILKILLWILLVILGIITVVFLIPIGGKVSFVEGKFSFEVFASFIPVINSEKKGLLDKLKGMKRKKSDSEPSDSDWSEYDDITDDDVTDDTVSDKTDEKTEITVSDEVKSEEDETDSEILHKEDISEKKPEKDKKKSGKKKKQKSEKTPGDKVEFLLDIWRAADRPLIKIFKGFRFSDVYIDFVVANEDAYNCAVTYGAVSGAVYNLLAFIGTVFTIKFRTVDINAGFGLRESRWDASLKVDFRLGTVVIAGVWFLLTYIFRIFIPNKINQRKLKKINER